MVHHRILVIIYPAQGHINPALQFAKRLIAMHAHVTLVITVHMHRRMPNKPTITGLSLATFSDGYDGGFKAIDGSDADYMLYMSEFKRRGYEFVNNLIASSAKEGHPFTCIAYTLLVPWAQEVAREFHLPTTLLWIEPATVFVILYHYFHGYDEYVNEKSKQEPYSTPSSCSIELPGLPLLFSPSDIPSFLLVARPSFLSFILPFFEEQFQELDKEENPIVLVNTFEALEPEALRAVDRLKMIPIGPLIPSAFLDGKDPNDTSFGGDLFQASNECVEWLDSKEELSVVYVSFGSYFELSKRQTEEIARALLDCGRPFLWIVREKLLPVQGREEEEEELMSCIEELQLRGKIVKWCSQVEVLSHPSLSCFVTHCGWNSTMESLVSGVPVVAFPQWSDQKTNAKLIEDVWKTGVRVDHKMDEEGTVHAEEIKGCLDVVMGCGEKANELRSNAKRWKILAREAAMESGPSERNIRAVLDDVGQCMRTARS